MAPPREDEADPGRGPEADACAADAARRLRSEGYIVLKGVLTAEQCDAVRAHVLATADEAIKQGRSDLFGNIQEAHNRCDLKLDLCHPVVEALNAFGARCKALLQDTMGPQVRIVELAAITSSRGAVAQPVHADTMHGVTRFLYGEVDLPGRELVADGDNDDEATAEDLASIIKAVATDTALIYTSLIALQDIDEEMGPTHVWPGTNTVEHHATLWGTHVGGKLCVTEADRAFGVPHRKMTLSQGDLVLYDSRTMHCGGANNSDKRRSVFCVSCMGPGIRPDGTTWTMLASLRNQLALSDLPLPPTAARAPANSAGGAEVRLPPPADAKGGGGAAAAAAEGGAKGGGAEPRPVPPLEEWLAAVQCTLCRRWRPCTQEEAPRLTGMEAGFHCPRLGFSCMQDQVYTAEQIDALF